MKRYRIFRVGNYIYITSEDGQHIWTGLVKDVRVIQNTENRRSYKILNVRGWGCNVTLRLTQILKEDGTQYSLEEWEEFYQNNTGNFNSGGGVPFDPSAYDLEEFQNGGADPFVRFSDLEDYEEDPTIVANYSALPDPATVEGQIYITQNSQGTAWLPGSLGGTYYPEGFYYSDGIEWIYQKSAYQATQTEVNTGTNSDKFVTPSTLAQSDYVLKYGWTLDFMEGTLDVTLYAPYDFKINSVTDVNNAPVAVIEVNGTPYTLGTSIIFGDEIDVSVDGVSVITLDIEKI